MSVHKTHVFLIIFDNTRPIHLNLIVSPIRPLPFFFSRLTKLRKPLRANVRFEVNVTPTYGPNIVFFHSFEVSFTVVVESINNPSYL